MLCSLGSYFYILFCGKSLLYTDDGRAQHLPALAYWGKYLRSYFKQIITGHGFTPKMFDFSIGYGHDVIQSLHYYVIGNPLYLLSVFVPVNYTEYLYNFLIILMPFLAGITFSLVCFYRKLPKRWTLVGSLVYISSGYAIYGFYQIMFLIPLVLLPLLILGVDKLFKEKKPCILILAVFLSLISNYYFSFISALIVICYVLIKIFVKNQDNIKTKLLKLISFFLCGLVGLGCSLFIILPMYFSLENSYRGNSSKPAKMLFSFQYYLNNFPALNTISSSNTGGIALLGVGTIAVFVLFFLKKSYIKYKIAFLIMALFYLSEKFSELLNLNLYASGRWLYAFAFFSAFITVLLFNKIKTVIKNYLKFFTIFLLIYFLTSLLLPNAQKNYTIFGVFIFLLYIIFFIYQNTQKRFALFNYTTLIMILLVNSLTITTVLFAPDLSNRLGAMEDFGNYRSFTVNSPSKLIKGLNDKSFYRYDTEFLHHKAGHMEKLYSVNESLVNGLKNTSNFLSVSNKNIFDFYKSLALPLRFDFYYTGLGNNQAAMNLTGVKYFIQKSKTAIDDTVIETNNTYKKVLLKDNLMKIRKSNSYMHFSYGYNFDSVLDENYIKNMPIENRDISLFKNGSITSNSNDKKINYDTMKQIPYKIKSPENNCIQINNNKIYVFCGYQTIQLKMQNTKNNKPISQNSSQNIRLIIDGLKFSSISCLEAFNEMKKNNYSLNPDDFNKNNEIRCKIDRIIRDETKGDGTYITLSYSNKRLYRESQRLINKYGNWFPDKQEYQFIANNAKDTLDIIFSTPGIYDYSSIRLVKEKEIDYKTLSKEMNNKGMKNLKIKNNQISGHVENLQKELLVTQIPFSTAFGKSAWRVYDNGKEIEAVKANIGFTGIILEPGNHNLIFKYETPGLKIGAIISLCSIFLFLIIIIISRFKSRKNDNQ